MVKVCVTVKGMEYTFGCDDWKNLLKYSRFVVLELWQEICLLKQKLQTYEQKE